MNQFSPVSFLLTVENSPLCSFIPCFCPTLDAFSCLIGNWPALQHFVVAIVIWQMINNYLKSSTTSCFRRSWRSDALLIIRNHNGRNAKRMRSGLRDWRFSCAWEGRLSRTQRQFDPSGKHNLLVWIHLLRIKDPSERRSGVTNKMKGWVLAISRGTHLGIMDGLATNCQP